MKPFRMRLVAALMIVSLAGCQSIQRAPEPVPEHIPSLAKVAFATGRFAPKIDLTAVARGKSDAAGKGAAAGAGECFKIMSGQGGSGIAAGIAALATLVCLPIAAMVGGSKGAREAAAEADIDNAEARLKSMLGGLTYERAFGEYLAQYATDVGLSPFLVLDDQGPSRPDEAPAYRAPRDRALDTIIDVSITDIAARTAGTTLLSYALLVKAQGRVVRVEDQAVLDSFAKIVWTSPRPLEELMADEGRLLLAELRRMYREIAEAFVDEWLLIDHRLRTAPAATERLAGTAGHDDTPADEVQERRVPAYVVHPIYPKLELAGGIFREIPPRHLGPLDPVPVDTLRPTLRWETYPRPHDQAHLALHGAKPRDVKYDVRIFRGQKLFFFGAVSPFFGAGAPVHIERGLAEPHYQLPEPLEPCTLYFWTVRARYVSEGRTRATEWSGAYDRGVWGYTSKPWLGRRSRGRLPNGYYYFPFRTPPQQGQKCDAL